MTRKQRRLQNLKECDWLKNSCVARATNNDEGNRRQRHWLKIHRDARAARTLVRHFAVLCKKLEITIVVI